MAWNSFERDYLILFLKERSSKRNVLTIKVAKPNHGLYTYDLLYVSKVQKQWQHTPSCQKPFANSLTHYLDI